MRIEIEFGLVRRKFWQGCCYGDNNIFFIFNKNYKNLKIKWMLERQELIKITWAGYRE